MPPQIQRQREIWVGRRRWRGQRSGRVAIAVKARQPPGFRLIRIQRECLIRAPAGMADMIYAAAN